MTTRLVAVRRNADFKSIAEVLRRFRVSACPVIDDARRVRDLGVTSGAVQASVLGLDGRGEVIGGRSRDCRFPAVSDRRHRPQEKSILKYTE